MNKAYAMIFLIMINLAGRFHYADTIAILVFSYKDMFYVLINEI